MNKKYIVELEAEERRTLKQTVRSGKHSARRIRWAHALDPAPAGRIATTVDWRFTTQDARIKLKRLYPSFVV